MQIDIPGTDNDIDTSDPAESASNLGGAVAGFVALFGIIGAASYVYSRGKEFAGVDEDANIPGI